MKTAGVTINPADPTSLAAGRIDAARVAATTEEDIATHQAADEAGAVQDAAKFARRVRKRLGLSQLEFSQRIEVSLETIPRLGTRKTLSDRSCQGAAQGAGQSSRSRTGGVALIRGGG